MYEGERTICRSLDHARPGKLGLSGVSRHVGYARNNKH